MKKAPIALLLAVAAFAILAYPSTTSAIPIHVHTTALQRVSGLDAGPPVITLRPVTEVVNVAPPDSDDDGCADADDSYDGPGCTPPPEPTVVTPSYGTTPATPAASTVTGGCVGMEAESGSAGYSAMSSTGYIGCYQISPEHFSSGSCAGLGTDPAGQDACAAIICQTEGAGAWTNPAGENPCGRLGG